MSATDQSLTPLPAADELAWLDYLAATAAGKVTELVEHLEQAFTFDKVGARRDFEPMSLEQLGSYLLLSRELTSSAAVLRGNAERLGMLAHSIYTSHEDTGRGVVTGVAGVEPYRKYRERIADRFTEASVDAVEALREADES